MDCYNWRNCEANCDHCEVAGIEAAKAVQAWNDPDYLVKYWSPGDILELLQQLGRQAQAREEQRDQLRGILEEWVDAQEEIEAEQQNPPGGRSGAPLMRLLHAYRRAREVLGRD